MFQSNLNFPVRKSCRESVKKSSDSPKNNVKRNLFEKVSPSSKRNKQDENSVNRLSKKKLQDDSSFLIAKKLFHTDQPSKLVGRSQEISEIENFIGDHVNKRQAGSMYISGAPGTGKTSCLMTVIESWNKKLSYAFVNCFSVKNPTDIYSSIAKGFHLQCTDSNNKNVVKRLENYITKQGTMKILVLDEIDHLVDSKGQEVLYSLFQWPQLTNSSLILIGIANALDLTDRLLPRLQIFQYEPKLLHFQPYSKDQIIGILEDRLSSLQKSSAFVIKPVALQFCARKIAACTGDIRKALEVCRRAVDLAERRRKNNFTLQCTSDDRCNPGSPMKGSGIFCIDIDDVNAVLQETYGSRLLKSETSKDVAMTSQQMILLCTLILMKKHCRVQDMNVGKLYDIYKRVCKKRDITAMTEWELNGLCKLLETQGFILMKPGKAIRMAKIILKIDESEAEFLLQDKTLLVSILSDKSVLSIN